MIPIIPYSHYYRVGVLLRSTFIRTEFAALPWPQATFRTKRACMAALSATSELTKTPVNSALG